jgi:hypothetical protein
VITRSIDKWYREARYAYRKDLRIASAKVIERPKSLKWADRKKNMIKWIRWTNMKIAETAQDSQSHGLRLLSANEDGDGDSSSSEYEGSSDDEETSEEEALIKKAKVDDRKRDRRVDSSPSKSDSGRKRRLESSPSKSEDERKKKQRKDQDRSKGKDREGERSRDPTVTPRAWSPGLYTAGASPESKKKEEKRQKMEKLKRQRERRERREEAERKRKEDEASDVIEIPSTTGSFIEIPSTGGRWAKHCDFSDGYGRGRWLESEEGCGVGFRFRRRRSGQFRFDQNPAPLTYLYIIIVDRSTASDQFAIACRRVSQHGCSYERCFDCRQPSAQSETELVDC